MVEPVFDRSITPGVALSRSRFEDRSFSLGDNLKDGVQTGYGIVRVTEHTEFELVFNDPATGRLHPGVRETIRTGSNLYVKYPGYSDYRHIPVIGKGVSFQMPGSPDTWGMMCEADLEEVYRVRPLSYRSSRALLCGVAWISASARSCGASWPRARPASRQTGFPGPTPCACSACSRIQSTPCRPPRRKPGIRNNPRPTFSRPGPPAGAGSAAASRIRSSSWRATPAASTTAAAAARSHAAGNRSP